MSTGPNHYVVETVSVRYDGGGYSDDEGYIVRGDRRLQEALYQFGRANDIYPLQGTSWGDGAKGSGGGVYLAEHKEALEEFFRQFYLDNPDFPVLPSKS